MFTVSLAVHAVFVAALLVMPASWSTRASEDRPEAVMTISLGGPAGPGESGLTPIGGRPIQQILRLPEATRPQWTTPPAPVPTSD